MFLHEMDNLRSIRTLEKITILLGLPTDYFCVQKISRPRNDGLESFDKTMPVAAGEVIELINAYRRVGCPAERRRLLQIVLEAADTDTVEWASPQAD